MKSLISKFFELPVYVHLLAIAALSIFLVYIVLKYIDSYTNHNQAVLVPDIRGLQIEEAAPFLEQKQLRYIVVDSIFSKEERPGAIIELTPEANSKVKQNRIISITVNAKTEESVSIPEMTDISYRQAYAFLKSLGFKDVEEKYVSGEFRDLTIGVEYKGQLVQSGTRIPLTAKLILVISDGSGAPQESKSTIEDQKESVEDDENWF
jgi:beta-lactam-binding protein with PASTA domain